MRNCNNNLHIASREFGAACTILIAYFIFEYIRPQYSLLPALSYLRIPMILSLVLFVIFLKGDKKILKDKLAILTILFIIDIGASVIYAVNTYFVWKTFFGMIVILLSVILVMPSICNTKYRLAKFVNLWIWIHVFVGIYSIFHSGQGPGGFLFDENDLSLTLNMVLPIPIYLSMSTNITSTRRFYYLSISILLVICIGVTMSRGGFLGLLSVFVVMWLLSENKTKNLLKIFLISVVLAFPVYQMIPESYVTEMSTISNSEDSTRLERQYSWIKGWEMFLDSPILGVGANNYPWNIAEYQLRDPEFDVNTMKLLGGRQAHSLYFTLISELGIVGIVIFYLILRQVFKKLFYVVRVRSSNEELLEEMLLAKALIVSTVTFLVTGAFISVLYYPPFWYLIGFTLTIYSIVCTQNVLEENTKCRAAR